MKNCRNTDRHHGRRISRITAFLLPFLMILQVPLSTNAEEKMNSETVVSLFPRLKNGWVGDVMPMNDGNKMKLFYLYDTDNNGAALMHPFYSFTTDNFYEFTNDGVTVKPTDDKKYQDYFGLGTGSYIRVGDTLHCFYTGVNTYISRTTAIMHAVSTDNGKTWEKKTEETIYPPDGYNTADYRDSQVFWCEEAGEYWMTVSGRCKTNGSENGVVILYTSDNLKDWTFKGNIFEPNHKYMLECSDIRKIGDKYYLFYSWDCITYYAMSDSVYGPYKDPADNVLSGNAFTFYAAKSAYLNGKCYLCGWLGRKIGKKDSKVYDWAGNMVIFEVKQKSDGTLALDAPSTYSDYFTKAFEFKPVGTKGDATVTGNGITLSGKNGISYVDMGELPKTMILTCKFTVDSYFSQGGLCFGTNGVGENSYYIMLNAANNRVQYDAHKLSNISAAKDNSGSYVGFRYEPGKEYTLKVVVEDEIIAFYINGEKTLVNRIYEAPGLDFGFFGAKSGVTFSDIEIKVTDAVTAKPGVPSSKRNVIITPGTTTKPETIPPETTVPPTEPVTSGTDSPATTEPSEKPSDSKPAVIAAVAAAAIAAIGGTVFALIRRKKKH